jgi:phosphoribosylformimino-5-aminoimidazole carboxamide ribotide isomerase
LGADVKGDKIAVGGWLETSEQDIEPFVESYHKEGIKYVICTDISKDGMLKGPAFDLYERLINGNPNINLIASGGVSNESELPKLLEIGCEGVIIGKAIYEKKISLQTLSEFNTLNS